ncbi:MAG: hypothetical protein LBQ67_02505 [Treponema sp.]|jgi:hypothetical protein|nr:hypothetical protein [Treponema sp.]
MIIRRRLAFFGSIFFLAAWTAYAQEPSLEELLPGLKDEAMIVDIVARVVEQNQQVVWNSKNSKVTIPGRPVGLKLVGTNIVVAVQFIPYIRRNGHNILVAQGQIWMNIPNEGIRYHTTMQTIPLEFGEEIFFFPLGSVENQDDARIEVTLILHPYTEGSLHTEETPQE